MLYLEHQGDLASSLKLEVKTFLTRVKKKEICFLSDVINSSLLPTLVVGEDPPNLNVMLSSLMSKRMGT